MSFDISRNNIKALKFRDELIGLLKKYGCELSTSKDTKNIAIEIYDKGSHKHNSYIMKNKSENYQLYTESKECVTDNILKSYFNKDIKEKHHFPTGIITNDILKGKMKLKEIYRKTREENVKRFCLGAHDPLLELYNGKAYRCVQPNSHARVYRFGKVIVDRNISLEELCNVVLPMCMSNYKEDIEIF